VIVVASTVFRALLSRRLPGPFIFVDELIYSELGRSFADGGRFLVRDVHTGGYGVVYPILISPAYRLFNGLPEAYAAVKVINSLVMSLAAVPAYLLARRVLTTTPALVVALLTVAVPSMVYTGTVMTENVFYGLFLLVTLVLVLALERPTARRQVVLLALVVAAYLTRAQALAFVPAVLVAPPLLAFFRRRRPWETLRAFAPLYGIVVVGGALVLAIELARGRSLRGLLGAYAVVSDQSYDVREIVDFLLWHAADLALYVGVIPLAATLLLVARARRETPQVQAFLAAAIPLAVSFTLVVAAFATRFASDRIHERNLFQLCPLLFVGLLAWAARPALPGRSGGRALGVVLVAAAALSPLTIPYSRFVGDPIRGDTLALLPLWTINRDYLFGSVLATVGIACGILGALVLLVPRRLAPVLPAVVLVWFAVLLHPVLFGPRGFEASSRGAVFQGIQGVPRDWIDRALPDGARVAVLWTGTSDRFTVNQNEFFNRDVGRVYYTEAPTPGGIGETPVRFDEEGTALLPDDAVLQPRYVLTDGSVTPNGTAVVRDEPLGMTVWHLAGPLVSMHSRVAGLYPGDTWSGAAVTWSARPCRTGGVLRVRLESDRQLFPAPPLVTGRSAVASAAVRVPLRGTTDLRVRVSPRDAVCTVRFRVSPTLVPRLVTNGSNPDPRRLGAHFLLFDYRPDRS
jgi:hypothetical protein